MSGESSNAGKAGSRRGHGKKAPTPKPRKPSRTLKGTSMAKKAPAKKPPLRPVPIGVTNAVHGGTPAKAKKPRVKAPIPAGTTIITHGAKLRKPTKPPKRPTPGPMTHNMGPAPKKRKQPAAAPPAIQQPIQTAPPQMPVYPPAPFTLENIVRTLTGQLPYNPAAEPINEQLITSLAYGPNRTSTVQPGRAPRSTSNDVGAYKAVRSMTTPAQMRAAHQATVPVGMTLISPTDQFKPHSHKFVVPPGASNPFLSDHPFPYDPETVGTKDPLPPGYRDMQARLGATYWVNAAAKAIGYINYAITGLPDDSDLIPYPDDTEVKP